MAFQQIVAFNLNGVKAVKTDILNVLKQYKAIKFLCSIIQ